MKKNITAVALLLIMLSTTICAYALPEPKTAHYPRGGMLTLTPSSESTNTYAFKADGKSHNKLRLSLNNAYSEVCGTTITIQIFVVNKWGNWVAFGEARNLTLSCTPDAYEAVFVIREKKPFCIVISSYGVEGECIIPYVVGTYS